MLVFASERNRFDGLGSVDYQQQVTIDLDGLDVHSQLSVGQVIDAASQPARVGVRSDDLTCLVVNADNERPAARSVGHAGCRFRQLLSCFFVVFGACPY